MAEYIEREAVGAEFECLTTIVNGEMYVRLLDVGEHFKRIPNADVVEVKHGRWVKPTKIGHRAFAIPHCSVCEGVPCGVDENTNYCPNCGARMDGDI